MADGGVESRVSDVFTVLEEGLACSLRARLPRRCCCTHTRRLRSRTSSE